MRRRQLLATTAGTFAVTTTTGAVTATETEDTKSDPVVCPEAIFTPELTITDATAGNPTEALTVTLELSLATPPGNKTFEIPISVDGIQMGTATVTFEDADCHGPVTARTSITPDGSWAPGEHEIHASVPERHLLYPEDHGPVEDTVHVTVSEGEGGTDPVDEFTFDEFLDFLFRLLF